MAIPSLPQLLALPRILTLRERLLLMGGVLALVVGVSLSITSWYRAATVEQPAIGGTYVEGLLGAPRFVNPLFAPANDVDQDLVRLLYAGLFRIDANGAIVPDLATGFTIADDGKKITVKLRDDARWHDGANITADDVLFTIQRIQSAEASSPLRGSFLGVTVARVDEHTVQFTVERPLAVFLSALTVGILPEHLWIDIPPAHLPLAELNLRPIGSGPFLFVGLTKDRRGQIRSYTLERYAGYHDEPPYLERIVFRFAESEMALLDALERREIDGVGALLPLAGNAVTRSDVVRHAVQLPQTTAVFLNERRQPTLKDVRVRKALSLAVNRATIVAEALGGAGMAIGGPIIPGFAAHASPPEPDAFDPDAAAAILDAAKWERVSTEDAIGLRMKQLLLEREVEKKKAGAKKNELAATDDERAAIATRVQEELAPCAQCRVFPYHRMANGTLLAIELVIPDAPELVAMAAHLADAWGAVGVHVVQQVVPLERVRGERIPNREYDALLFSHILGPDPDPFPFWHSSQVRHPGLNLSYFSNKTIDKLLEDARATLNTEERATKYGEFQERLLEERPAIFLVTPRYTYAVADAVRGMALSQLTQAADRFASVTAWYTDVQRVWK